MAVLEYPMDAEPGDFFVVNSGSSLAKWIDIGEDLIDGRKSEFTHAGIASRWQTGLPVYAHPSQGGRIISNNTLFIVQAEPHGAVEVPWYWGHCPHAWSTGKVPACPRAADYARSLIGTGYSFIDYLAIATHEKLHWDIPGLQRFIADTGHMICSQLVDQARLLGGSHLFSDGRWPGYVKPSDLGFLV
jgi:hypothetical protein